MARQGTWPKGQSGNPKGRPKKNRALTEILERAGSKIVEYDGKRVSGKRLIARLLWQAATTGECKLPDGESLIVKDFSDWLGVVKFLYAQIDGLPKQDIGLDHSGGVNIGFRDELACKLNRIAAAVEQADNLGESDG